MVKKVIQIPVDEDLLSALDQFSREQRKTRAEFIRQACQRYIMHLESEELDRLHQHGYERLPEEVELGEALGADWFQQGPEVPCRVLLFLRHP